MTNKEMVLRAAVMSGIYTGPQAAALEKANGGALPLYTFGEWKKRGYIVKKGQHAILTMNLWAYNKGKKDPEAPEEADGDAAPDEGFKLRKMHLFDFRQVERLAAADAV
ncbi:MAG: hypothetical protein IJR00_08115 [Lachnospiraceae bacterium]|nr:hypothetical protein [Lachnospiraceae bacterium]